MNKNTQSANTKRAADENAAIKSQAEIALDLAHKQEEARRNDPTLTAHVVQSDDKTLKLKWVKSDELNDSIGL